MTPVEIENALGQRLAAMGGATIVWPNQDANPARPFILFQHVPVLRTDRTLDGVGETATGYVTATVVAERDGFATAANTLAGQVMAQFPYGLALAMGVGAITINKPPEVLPGYPDGPDWRTPVRISYVAEEN